MCPLLYECTRIVQFVVSFLSKMRRVSVWFLLDIFTEQPRHCSFGRQSLLARSVVAAKRKSIGSMFAARAYQNRNVVCRATV